MKIRNLSVLALVVAIGLIWGILSLAAEPKTFDLSGYMKSSDEGEDMSEQSTTQLETAIIGGGCFWCIEAVFERINGVKSAVSGYAGGSVPAPTYKQVSSGRTGHAEVVRIAFDPDVITYGEILEIFFKSHDPTTLNRQGADWGTQYRSIILYETEEQRLTAVDVKAESQQHYGDPIVTEINPLDEFYEAEAYHQDYFELNPSAGYCQVVIAPKLEKLGLDIKQTF